MANYRKIINYFPAARHYLQQRKWVRRGDVLAYAPGVQTEAFSTDTFGFRHTRFQGRDVGLAEIETFPRVGLILGASHLFGFGLSANDETLPSRLSELHDYPVFGIAYPEADTRTLYGTLLRLLRQFPKRIDQIVLLTGGDFTRYCYVEAADPIFGPPFLPIGASPKSDAETRRNLANLLHFTTFWSMACAELAAQAGVGFYLAEDYTFFEKSHGDATETACALGAPRSAKQAKRFDVHRRHARDFGMERRRLSETLKLKLVRYPEADELLFIDEFHYRAESQRLIAERLAEQTV